jgi:hypothetical protein
VGKECPRALKALFPYYGLFLLPCSIPLIKEDRNDKTKKKYCKPSGIAVEEFRCIKNIKQEENNNLRPSD